MGPSCYLQVGIWRRERATTTATVPGNGYLNCKRFSLERALNKREPRSLSSYKSLHSSHI